MSRPHVDQPSSDSPRRPWPHRLLVAAALLLVVGWLVGSMLRPATIGSEWRDAVRIVAALPVVSDGRIKPMDTVARSSLVVLSGRTKVQRGGETIEPIVWLLDVISGVKQVDNDRVFRVDDPQVKAITMLPDSQTRKRFSFAELLPASQTIAQQYELARRPTPANRDAYQRHMIELYNKLTMFGQLQQAQRPHVLPPMSQGGLDLPATAQADAAGVPTVDPTRWRTMSQGVAAAHLEQGPDPMTGTWAQLLNAWRDRDAPAFALAADELTRIAHERLGHDADKAALEVWFNRIAPFYQGIVLYVMALVLCLIAWLTHGTGALSWAATLRRSAMWVVLIALLVHTIGLIARIYLQGRPPVTNLYSSAIFIGYFAVVLGLIIERYQRTGIGTAVGSIIGFATLVVAHNLADGDTMQMMQAVLDSNFWLATHVIVITLGYSAAFVAGGLGAVYILAGVYTRAMTPQRRRRLAAMIYGTVAFTLLLSFVGTVLGGIWADQSWGRFWGWDPKENGAALIVLHTAIILHARWGGMIKLRGLAVLAVGGNIVTSWSWFGTNMLGVGLHSYGFMDAAVFWMLAFVSVNLAIMALGLMPQHRWLSFADDAGEPTPSAPTRPTHPTPTTPPTPHGKDAGQSDAVTT